MISAGTTKEELEEIYEDITSTDGALLLLQITPERLKSKTLQKKFAKCYSDGRLRRFVIDEAHCCSQWGFDFRTDYFKLGQIRLLYPKTPIMALTATATNKVLRDVERILNLKDCCTITGNLAHLLA